MATNTPILGLKKPVPNVEENWAFRLNESLDILDQSLLVGNASSVANVTTFNDGIGHLLVSGSTNPVFEHVEAITFNSDYVTVATGTFTEINVGGITNILGTEITTTSGIFDDVVVNGVSLTTQTPVDNSFKLLFNATDRKAANTDGGTFTSGAWRTRTLNSVDSNLLPGASLAANQITLSEPGDYYIEWSTPAYRVNRHKSILYNITAAQTEFVGSNEYSNINYQTQTISTGNGKFHIDTPTTFEIRHRCETTHATFGLGVDSNFGEDEIYTQVKIWPSNPVIASFDSVLATSGTFDESLTVSGVPVNIGAGSGDTLQNSYDNGDGTIATVSGKPFELTGSGVLVAVTGTFTDGLTVGSGSTFIDSGRITTASGIFTSGNEGALTVGDDPDSAVEVLQANGRIRCTRGLRVGRSTIIIEDDYITASGITTITGCFTEAIYIGDPLAPTVISGSDSGAASFEAIETEFLRAFEARVDDRIYVGVSGAGPQSLLGISVLETLNVIASGSVFSPVGLFPDALGIPQYPVDPSPEDGDVWINTTTSGIRWQVNGTVFEVQGSEVV